MSSYPNLAKSVHSFMIYQLKPFSIAEYLGVTNSISEETLVNGAPNTKPMSTPGTAPARSRKGRKSGRCSKRYK